MDGPGHDEPTREVAYAEFLRSRGAYPRAALFLDADRRGEIDQDETELDGEITRHRQGTRQPEPARR